jgi:hypothetical protein
MMILKERCGKSFNRLAGYKFCNNKNKQKMTITAAVFQEQVFANWVS